MPFVMSTVSSIGVPPGSRISRELHGADFFDAYAVSLDHGDRPALDLYLRLVAATPAWVNFMMALRNRIVARLGLKDLGPLGGVDAGRPAADYRAGDRVGIFTLLSASDEEIILGDTDRHLDVKVSVCRLGANGGGSLAVTTVVHLHNRLGRVYLRLVAPVHRRVVAAVLGRAPVLCQNA